MMALPSPALILNPAFSPIKTLFTSPELIAFPAFLPKITFDWSPILKPGIWIEPNEPVEVTEPLMFPLAWIVPVTSNACVGADLRIPTCPSGSIAIAVIGVPATLILK